MILVLASRLGYETVITMGRKWALCLVLLERHGGSSRSSGEEELGKSGL